MRALIQRVDHARVTVSGKTVGSIAQGFLLLLGICTSDTYEDVTYLAKKTVNLRVFPDQEGKMNRSLSEVDGAILVVSQFTLYANTRKGNRPSFVHAAAPFESRTLYESFVDLLMQSGPKIETGVFGAHMSIALVNDGPVTILLDSADRHRSLRL